jgi:hypothetical protein
VWGVEPKAIAIRRGVLANVAYEIRILILAALWQPIVPQSVASTVVASTPLRRFILKSLERAVKANRTRPEAFLVR